MGIQSEKEQLAWAPPIKLKPTEWVEKYRFLPASTSAEPGRFRFDRTPYLKEICDSAADPAIRQIVCLKAVQIGWSELQRSVLAWQIDQEPGPTLFVMPSQDSARELVDERIKPLIENTPVIAAHLSPDTDDFTKSGIKFDTMNVYMGWSGSPQALASRPIRYVNFDEVDKYPPFSGKEADPISLGTVRTATFGHRAKIAIGSTPTIRTGAIWKAFEGADTQKCYFVPCPHCQHFQRLTFPAIKWPELDIADNNKKATTIERDELAWLQCEGCKGKIFSHHKHAMLNAGMWVGGHLETDGQWVADQSIVDGKLVGECKAARVGYWIPALYSPWKSFSAIAAEFIRSTGDMGKMMNFKNSWLAEPFEEQVVGIKSADIAELKLSAPKPKVIPGWAQMVLATADVQMNGDLCYYVVRAWGEGYQSQLLDFGTVPGVEALKTILNKFYPIGENAELGEAGVNMLCVDCKYMPNRVFQFAATDARIHPVFGSSQTTPTQPIKVSVGSKQLGIEKRELNTNYYKDMLADRRRNGLWLVHSGITDDYIKQLASEHKVIDPKTQRMVWTPISQGIANHYLDCETYQQAAADIAGVNLLTSQLDSDEDDSGTDFSIGGF